VTLLLDCDEVYMRQQCATAAEATDDDYDAVTSRRISEYKHSTLPVLGYLEDHDKLDMVLVKAFHQNYTSRLLHSVS